MDIFVFTIAYLSATAFFIFILLFGESPVFNGTPVAWLHWLVTIGICNVLEFLLPRVCGARGSRAVDSCITALCERPNPALQVAYVVLVTGGFAVYWTSLFSLLPNPWVDEGHILTGSASVIASLALFLAASLSDPGTVRPHPPADLAAWHRLYPLDGAIFPAKQCPTCHLMRPARSKHCRVCNRCVARHDHHCQWINNCVGFNNLRIFLAFLVANVAMCGYGTVLAVLILGGEMERRSMFSVRWINYRTGEVRPLWKTPRKLVEWLVVFHPVGVAMTLFMAVATLLLTFFLSYQIYLLLIGRTQYEVFKWREFHHALLEMAEQQAEAEAEAEEKQAAEKQAAATASRPDVAVTAVRNSEGGSRREAHGGKDGCWRRLWGLLSCSGGQGGDGARSGQRRRVRLTKLVLPQNIYHRGFWANTWEVLLPEVYFQRARAAVVRGNAVGMAASLSGSCGSGTCSGGDFGGRESKPVRQGSEVKGTTMEKKKR
ncbi:hypothetical protein Vretimale_331 [Volvox reticuliferus]|uniref:S-acyltransferase n=1 Tax=Volvox reticuliferus TaxID=1737510 RepID=A0A8J4FF36_9CHLO|nr:hypothetical protein Vretifemale_2564 [Volvox reticuliferus]GIL94160.1 hypothetical protein Vretimale_331 [Volvox reticuliferus]